MLLQEHKNFIVAIEEVGIERKRNFHTVTFGLDRKTEICGK